MMMCNVSTCKQKTPKWGKNTRRKGDLVCMKIRETKNEHSCADTGGGLRKAVIFGESCLRKHGGQEVGREL